MENPDAIATDDNCRGYCECPDCGGSAFWSFVSRAHACNDPACRREFTEHNATPHGWTSRDDIRDASGRLIAPPQTPIAERPDGPWRENGKP